MLVQVLSKEMVSSKSKEQREKVQDSLALLSASVLRFPEMSRLLNRHTTFASTFPLAVCEGRGTG